MTSATPPPSLGVVLRPGSDGRVSSTRIGQDVVAVAAAAADMDLSDCVRGYSRWHRDYIEAYRALLTSAAHDAHGAAAMSKAGAEELIRQAGIQDEDEMVSVAEGFSRPNEPLYDTLVAGGQAMRERDFSVPYQGRRLFGY